MDIRDEIIELENADGIKAKFAFLEAVEYEGENYVALEAIENGEGLEEGDTVIFRLIPDEEDLELVTDEDLLDILFEKIEEALQEVEEM